MFSLYTEIKSFIFAIKMYPFYFSCIVQKEQQTAKAFVTLISEAESEYQVGPSFTSALAATVGLLCSLSLHLSETL